MRLGVPDSRRTLAIYLAAGASFAALSARGLTVPLYAHQLGADRFQVGALFSVATLAAALLSMPAGVLIDRFGTRTLLILALIITAGSQVAMAFSTTVAPLFVWQIVGGLAAGAQQAALFSAVSALVPSGRLGRAMGWLTFSMQAGFFLGPSIAGLLLQWVDLRTDIAVTTVVLVFAVPGSVAASSAPQSDQRFAFVKPLRGLVTQRAFTPVVIGLVAATLATGTMGAFLPIFAKESLGLPNSQIGLLLAIQAVVNGLARIPGGRLVDRAKQRWPIVFVGALVLAVTLTVLGHLNGFWAPVVLLVISTPFAATVFVSIATVFGDMATGSTRGVTMGAYGTVLFLGLAAGPLAFGPIVQAYGYAAGFTACAVASVVLALVMAAFHAEPLRPRSEIPLPPPAPGT
ncbi:MAG TPA: MFS transporter [Candidatus Dormibacteraeota bacterium]